VSSPRKTVCFLAALVFISTSPAAAQGTYTEIEVPGATFTYPLGIDDNGDVVGWYSSNSGSFGFLLRKGSYTKLQYPGSSTTVAYGINDYGQIVGYTDQGSGFLYDMRTRDFAEVSYPGAAQTFPTSINNSGVIAGGFSNGADTSGFELLGSKHRQIAPEGATAVYVWGISAAGEAVGTAGGPNFFANFECRTARCRQLAIPNAPNATVARINFAGTAIVGWYIISTGVDAGFLYANRTLTTIQFPGAMSTYCFGVNNQGEVTGRFYDVNGNPHGFTWVTTDVKKQ